MEKNDLNYMNYQGNLNEKLVADKSIDLTAIAYATAEAKKVLGEMPEKAIVEVSGDIIKNVKKAMDSGKDDLKSIKYAIAAGIVAGRPEKKLEAISEVTQEEKKKIEEYINAHIIEVKQAETAFIFDIQVNLIYEKSFTKIRIVNNYTNVILIEKNDDIIYIKEASLSDDNLLRTGENIGSSDFIDIKDIKDMIGKKK